jgi:hypothetical protein
MIECHVGAIFVPSIDLLSWRERIINNSQVLYVWLLVVKYVLRMIALGSTYKETNEKVS